MAFSAMQSLPDHLVSQGYSLEFYQARDRDAVSSLMRDYFKEIGIELDPQSLDYDIMDPVKAYSGGGLLVVKKQGLAVGCAGVRRFEDQVAEFKRMYLDPGHRGGGLGRALLDAAIALARSKGYRQLLLDTMLKLTAANRLYESAGFTDTHDYSNNPRAQRFMVLNL